MESFDRSAVKRRGVSARLAMFGPGKFFEKLVLTMPWNSLQWWER
jgi:hypothetical protein